MLFQVSNEEGSQASTHWMTSEKSSVILSRWRGAQARLSAEIARFIQGNLRRCPALSACRRSTQLLLGLLNFYA